MKRDGHCGNVSGIAPDELGDVDHLAGRANLLLDLPHSIGNDRNFALAESQNRCVLEGLFDCKPGNATCQAT